MPTRSCVLHQRRFRIGEATIPMHRSLAETIVDGDEDAAVAIMARIMDRLEDDVRVIMQG